MQTEQKKISSSTFPTKDKGERIARYLARCGVASRRDIEKMIQQQRICVDGTRLTHPATFVNHTNLITVDNKIVTPPEKTKLWLYYKPVGLVTTHKDPQNRPTVFESLPDYLPHVISVGRLDLNSEGLLLLTNDGSFSRKLELPNTQCPRIYRVRVYGEINPHDLSRLKNGISINGIYYGSIIVYLDNNSSRTSRNTWLTIELTEGKNREIRRICNFLGLKVNRLIRISYGPYKIGDLKPGDIKEVLPKDIEEFLHEEKGQ